MQQYKIMSMQTFSLKMTTQRQVTYPQQLLDILQLSAGDVFQIQVIDSKTKLTRHLPVRDFLSDLKKAATGPQKKYASPTKHQIRELMSEHIIEKNTPTNTSA